LATFGVDMNIQLACKILIKNSQPLGKNFTKPQGGG